MKFFFTKNINITKPLAKLVKLLTATVIIASLHTNSKNRIIIHKEFFTEIHYDENHYNLQMPLIHQNPVPMKKMFVMLHQPIQMHH